MHVVGEVVERGQAESCGREFSAGQGDEVDVIDADIADAAGRSAAFAAPAIDEVDDAVADALDGRDVELHRPAFRVVTPGAQFDRTTIGVGGVIDAKRNGADRWAVQPSEALGEGVGFGVDDEVDLTLPIQRHVLVPMAGDGDEAHAFEKLAKRNRIGCRVLDELEAVSAHRVVPRRELHGLVSCVLQRRWQAQSLRSICQAPSQNIAKLELKGAWCAIIHWPHGVSEQSHASRRPRPYRPAHP
jgi:hypothetical protein